MPLNLSVNDGDFAAYLKYNAKAGRFYAKPEGGTEEVEIHNPLLAFNMAAVRTGWLYYAEGSGPEKIWDPSPQHAAERPPGPKKFKRGFEVMVYGNTVIPGTQQKLGLREFSSTAGNVIAAMLRMHAEYEAGMAANVGKYPVYACDQVKPITGMYGVNYEPIFTLKMWVDRSRVPEFDAPPAHKPAPATSSHDSFAGQYPARAPMGNGTAIRDNPNITTGRQPAPAQELPDDEIPF